MPIDPSSLRIVLHPDPVLRKKALPVGVVTEEVRAVATRMIELMRQANGIGLAAPQVGLAWRMFVCDVPEDDERDEDRAFDGAGIPAVGVGTGDVVMHSDGAVVYIDPLLSGYSRDLEPHEEGCLSLPRIHGLVRRPSMVTVTATGLDGRSFTQTVGGMLARCIQHENDHLDGVLILDKMAQPDRLRNRSLVRELEGGPGAPGTGARR